jgi:hypothetical protein
MKKRMNWAALLLCFIMTFLQGCAGTEGQQNLITEETTDNVVSESLEQEEPLQETEDSEETDTSVEEESDLTFREDAYYYSQLSEEEQLVYKQVYRSVLNRQEVTVNTLSEETLGRVFDCVMLDYPEIFYVSGYTYTTHSRNDEVVSLTFLAKYDYDQEECEKRETLIEAEAERMLSGLSAEASDYDKIKYVFDTLINETEYVTDAKDNQNICSVFLYHESVCQGYAEATQYLLEKVGIQATCVNGDVEGDSHAWNLVMADGAWYYLDTTWGDVDYQSQMGDSEVSGEVMTVNYDYFMITSERLYETHTPNRIVPLPDCIATKDNYYVHEGLYLTGLDTEVLQNIFERAYQQGLDTVQFQCANEAVFEQVSNYLLDEQHIFDFVNAADTVSYIDNTKTYTFCFWI